MKAARVCLGLTALFAFTLSPLAGQEPTVTLRLGPREFTTRDGPLELFRVRDVAAIGRDVAILDSGNSRIVVLDAAGRTLRQFGGSGEGPGEFRGMSSLWVTNGSIVVADALLPRLTFFDLDGQLQRTIAVPTFDERTVEVAGVAWDGAFIGISRAPSTFAPGPETRSATLLRLSGSNWVPFATVPWERNYVHVESGGASVYNPPFLGRGIIRADSIIAIGQLDGGSIEITGEWGRPAVTPLPVARRQVTRGMINLHRDSLLVVAQSSPSTAQRIREVFDEDFVAGNLVPAISDLQIVGGDVWTRAYPDGTSDSVDWFILRAADGRVSGRLSLPKTTRVLGGDRERVFLVEVDELGVESVSVYLKPL